MLKLLEKGVLKKEESSSGGANLATSLVLCVGAFGGKHWRSEKKKETGMIRDNCGRYILLNYMFLFLSPKLTCIFVLSCAQKV